MCYSKLIPLLKKKGSNLTPKEFQERVNIVFHDHESELYDEIHANMKNSLQEQVELLVSDLLNYPNFIPKKIKMLDLGCGTGLSTEFLLKSRLEPLIEHITLVDSSKKMLEQAQKKAAIWNKNFTIINSYVSNLNEKYDLVLICSVLHHIPDLKSFLNQVANVMNPQGILIHLQDPNGDYLNDKIYKERLEFYEAQKSSEGEPKKIKAILPKKIKGFLNRLLGRKNYIDLINDQLLKEKVIKKRMTADELWSVTDIHVETKEEKLNKGISLTFLKKQLKNFTLIQERSYGFFGRLKSDLDKDFEQKEEKFISQKQLNGRNISCVWIKK